jgi:hypothetical protein
MYVPARAESPAHHHHFSANGIIFARTAAGGPMDRLRRSRLFLAIAVALVIAPAGCTSPNALAGLQVQLNDAADAMNNLQQNLATLQTSIDSMNVVLAKQDTTIQRLANAAGIPVAK